MNETPDGVPRSAMRVEHGIDESSHENYVSFPVTDVIEWYTVRENGEVETERFTSTDPDNPADMREFLEG